MKTELNGSVIFSRIMAFLLVCSFSFGGVFASEKYEMKGVKVVFNEKENFVSHKHGTHRVNLFNGTIISEISNASPIENEGDVKSRVIVLTPSPTDLASEDFSFGDGWWNAIYKLSSAHEQSSLIGLKLLPWGENVYVNALPWGQIVSPAELSEGQVRLADVNKESRLHDISSRLGMNFIMGFCSYGDVHGINEVYEKLFSMLPDQSADEIGRFVLVTRFLLMDEYDLVGDRAFRLFQHLASYANRFPDRELTVYVELREDEKAQFDEVEGMITNEGFKKVGTADGAVGGAGI